MRVGRSHIAATVNTLFMAYVGASLPVIVFLGVSAQPTLLTLNREIFALEVVRTVAGSLGIVLAMPLTTAIAIVLIGRRPVDGRASHHGDSSSHGPMVTAIRPPSNVGWRRVPMSAPQPPAGRDEALDDRGEPG
jgi:hypothetical protein